MSGITGLLLALLAINARYADALTCAYCTFAETGIPLYDEALDGSLPENDYRCKNESDQLATIDCSATGVCSEAVIYASISIAEGQTIPLNIYGRSCGNAAQAVGCDDIEQHQDELDAALGDLGDVVTEYDGGICYCDTDSCNVRDPADISIPGDKVTTTTKPPSTMQCKQCVQFDVSDQSLEYLLMQTVDWAHPDCKDKPRKVPTVHCPNDDDTCYTTAIHIELVDLPPDDDNVSLTIYSRGCTDRIEYGELGCKDSDIIEDEIRADLGMVSQSVTTMDGVVCYCNPNKCNVQKSNDIVLPGPRPLCLSDCAGMDDGDYQWCGGCHKFLTCSHHIPYLTSCPGNLVWDDNKRYCDYSSATCKDPSDITG